MRGCRHPLTREGRTIKPWDQTREPAGRAAAALRATPRLDRWLRIDPGGWVEVFPGRVELGQGILSALAQVVADALGLGPHQVRMRTAGAVSAAAALPGPAASLVALLTGTRTRELRQRSGFE